jgi:hypothetical protein
MKAQPGKRQEIVDQFAKWERDQKAKATGFLRSFVVVSNDGSDDLMAGVRWDSTENYRANSERAEQSDWYQELRGNLAADPEWFDGTLALEVLS